MDLDKGRGEIDECPNSKDIVIRAWVASHYHGWIRSKVAQAIAGEISIWIPETGPLLWRRTS